MRLTLIDTTIIIIPAATESCAIKGKGVKPKENSKIRLVEDEMKDQKSKKGGG